MKKLILPLILVIAAIGIAYFMMQPTEGSVEFVDKKAQEVVSEVADEQTAQQIVESVKVDSTATAELDSADMAGYIKAQEERLERIKKSDKKSETPESVLTQYNTLLQNLEEKCDTAAMNAFIKDFMNDEYISEMKNSNADFKRELRKLGKRRRDANEACQ